MLCQAGDWMAAVACAQAPRRAVTFADLPPQYRRDLLRISLASSVTSAIFVALAILAHPLPSRSFVSASAAPNAVVAPAPLRSAVPSLAAAVALPRPSRAAAMRPRAAIQVAALREVQAAAPPPSAEPPRPDRRRNVFSRFFRGVLRGFQPAVVKADTP